ARSAHGSWTRRKHARRSPRRPVAAAQRKTGDLQGPSSRPLHHDYRRRRSQRNLRGSRRKIAPRPAKRGFAFGKWRGTAVTLLRLALGNVQCRRFAFGTVGRDPQRYVRRLHAKRIPGAPESKLLRVHSERDFASFAGAERDALKSLQH